MVWFHHHTILLVYHAVLACYGMLGIGDFAEKHYPYYTSSTGFSAMVPPPPKGRGFNRKTTLTLVLQCDFNRVRVGIDGGSQCSQSPILHYLSASSAHAHKASHPKTRALELEVHQRCFAKVPTNGPSPAGWNGDRVAQS